MPSTTLDTKCSKVKTGCTCFQGAGGGVRESLAIERLCAKCHGGSPGASSSKLSLVSFSPIASLHHNTCHTTVYLPVYSLVSLLDCELLEGRIVWLMCPWYLAQHSWLPVNICWTNAMEIPTKELLMLFEKSGRNASQRRRQMNCVLERLIAVFHVEKGENDISERRTCRGREAQQDVACWGSEDHTVAEADVMVV